MIIENEITNHITRSLTSRMLIFLWSTPKLARAAPFTKSSLQLNLEGQIPRL